MQSRHPYFANQLIGESSTRSNRRRIQYLGDQTSKHCYRILACYLGQLHFELLDQYHQ